MTKYLLMIFKRPLVFLMCVQIIAILLIFSIGDKLGKYASPIAGKKDELFEALEENGYGNIITRTVNANTLSSFVKEKMAENDDEVPDWLTEKISTFEKVSVGIRKG